MKNAPRCGFKAGLALALLSLLILGCDDQSENIPVQWDDISGLMATGWNQYANGDYLGAKASFEAAGQRNALYLPSYDGLGWCAVRLTNFDDAEEQFSFITTLADPVAQMDLLADAYAGLSLSATIERSYLEITEGGEQETLDGLAQQSIDRANMVFSLAGENYSPVDHDSTFGSSGLHLLCAQNYFYLLEYENAEAQLSIVDPGFIPTLMDQVGQEITATLTLNREITAEEDTVWYLLGVNESGEVTYPGVHNVIGISALDTLIAPPDTTLVPDTLFLFSSEMEFHWDSQNRILIHPEQGTVAEIGKPFEVTYVYLDDFISYLYQLIEHIESLIEF